MVVICSDRKEYASLLQKTLGIFSVCCPMRSCIPLVDRYGVCAIILLPPFDCETARKFLVRVKTKNNHIKTAVILSPKQDNSACAFADLSFYLPLEAIEFSRAFLPLLPPAKTGNEAVRVGRLLITAAPYGVFARGFPLYLTVSEISVLRLLALFPDIILHAADISEICFRGEAQTGTVITHIAMINKKCAAACGEKLITNDRKNGYKINAKL